MKLLDDYESRGSDNAFLDGKDYKYLLEEIYRWKNFINPQYGLTSWDDLKDFVNKVNWTHKSVVEIKNT